MKTTFPQTPQKDLQTITTVKRLHNYKPYAACRELNSISNEHAAKYFLHRGYLLKVALRLTYNTDLPDFNKGTLDVLDAG